MSLQGRTQEAYPISMQAPRILLAYASRHGSTREVAQAIAEVLTRRGMEVEIRPVEEVQDLEGYQAVLLGSPVQDQAWLPEAQRFVQTHHQALRQLPLVYFVLSGVLGDPTPEHFHEVYGYLAEVCRLAPPLELGLFAGALDYGRLSPEEQVRVLAKGLPEGDFRRWQDVRAWAEEVADRLALGWALGRVGGD